MNASFFHFNIFEGFRISHFVTERYPGYSSPPFDALNLALHTGDNIPHVMANRRMLSENTGIPSDSFIYINQVHSDQVIVIDNEMTLKVKANKQQTVADGDAMITAQRGLCLMVLTADCVPVLLYDTVKHVAGIIHAGWRGTVQHITSKTVARMSVEFGTLPEDVFAGIGPSIGPCCYEVGHEVVHQVQQAFGDTEGLILKTEHDHPVFDLWQTNRQELLASGVPDQQIELSGQCTKCNHRRYFSSRANNGITGRLGAGIMLQ